MRDGCGADARRWLAIALVSAAACRMPPADDVSSAGRRADANLEAARDLDRQGITSFREGRFADAIRYFRAAYRLGGPPSELWNIARCREHLDDAEGAAEAIEEYLAQRGLTPQDRAEAEREERALRSRSSMLTVTTTPVGAEVVLDGAQPIGATPLTAEIRPGSHSIVVRLPGYAVERRPLEARFGRAVIVSLDLAKADK